MVRLLFSVIAPLNVGLEVEVMLSVPLLPEATVIGFGKVRLSPINVALALPVESPRVIVPVPEPPKALVLVVPLTVPALMVRPPVNVLAPDRVNCEVVLFWMTPVTFVPMIELIVTMPEPAFKFVTVPKLLTVAVERVRVKVLEPLSTRSFDPITPPLNMQEVAEGAIVIVPV